MSSFAIASIVFGCVDCPNALAIHSDGQSLAARLLRPRAIEHHAAAKGDPNRASRNLQKMSSGGHFPSWPRDGQPPLRRGWRAPWLIHALPQWLAAINTSFFTLSKRKGLPASFRLKTARSTTSRTKERHAV